MFEACGRLETEGGAESGAALTVRRIRHPNAQLITPLWLGDYCEGLSALYAAINGVRLALACEHRFTGPEVHQLMRAGLRYFDGRVSGYRANRLVSARAIDQDQAEYVADLYRRDGVQKVQVKHDGE